MKDRPGMNDAGWRAEQAARTVANWWARADRTNDDILPYGETP
jgi:hypothetical protein